MKKLISMAVAIMMLVSTTVTANAATKTRVLVEGNEGRFWQTYLVRDGQVMSANVEGKILDEHSIDVMSGNYLAAASIDELKRERAQCKVE